MRYTLLLFLKIHLLIVLLMSVRKSSIKLFTRPRDPCLGSKLPGRCWNPRIWADVSKIYFHECTLLKIVTMQTTFYIVANLWSQNIFVVSYWISYPQDIYKTFQPLFPCMPPVVDRTKGVKTPRSTFLILSPYSRFLACSCLL